MTVGQKAQPQRLEILRQRRATQERGEKNLRNRKRPQACHKIATSQSGGRLARGVRQFWGMGIQSDFSLRTMEGPIK